MGIYIIIIYIERGGKGKGNGVGPGCQRGQTGRREHAGTGNNPTWREVIG